MPSQARSKSWCAVCNPPGADCSTAAEQSKHLFVDPDRFVRRVSEILERARSGLRRAPRAGGRARPRARLINTPAGYGGHFWQYRDISDRTRDERRLRTLFDVSRAIAQADDEQDALARILSEAASGSDSNSAAISNATVTPGCCAWRSRGIAPTPPRTPRPSTARHA